MGKERRDLGRRRAGDRWSCGIKKYSPSPSLNKCLIYPEENADSLCARSQLWSDADAKTWHDGSYMYYPGSSFPPRAAGGILSAGGTAWARWKFCGRHRDGRGKIKAAPAKRMFQTLCVRPRVQQPRWVKRRLPWKTTLNICEVSVSRDELLETWTARCLVSFFERTCIPNTNQHSNEMVQKLVLSLV